MTLAASEWLDTHCAQFCCHLRDVFCARMAEQMALSFNLLKRFLFHATLATGNVPEQRVSAYHLLHHKPQVPQTSSRAGQDGGCML